MERRAVRMMGWADEGGLGGADGRVEKEEDNDDSEAIFESWIGHGFRSPERGALWQYCASGCRPGMAHPPRAESVRAELVAYLQECRVPCGPAARRHRSVSRYGARDQRKPSETSSEDSDAIEDRPSSAPQQQKRPSKKNLSRPSPGLGEGHLLGGSQDKNPPCVDDAELQRIVGRMRKCRLELKFQLARAPDEELGLLQQNHNGCCRALKPVAEASRLSGLARSSSGVALKQLGDVMKSAICVGEQGMGQSCTAGVAAMAEASVDRCLFARLGSFVKKFDADESIIVQGEHQVDNRPERKRPSVQNQNHRQSHRTPLQKGSLLEAPCRHDESTSSWATLSTSDFASSRNRSQLSLPLSSRRLRAMTKQALSAGGACGASDLQKLAVRAQISVATGNSFRRLPSP